MKKSLVLALACVFMLGSSAWSVAPITTLTSIADFSSRQGTVNVTINLKAISGGAQKDNIEWNVASIPIGREATTWTTSTVYAQITSDVTEAGGIVYIYQDNKNSTEYKATTGRDNYDGDVKTGTVFSGMVNKETGEASIPMVFCSTTTTATPNFGTDPETVVGTRYFIDRGNLKADGTTSDFDTDTNKYYMQLANTKGLVGGVTADNTGTVNGTWSYGTEGRLYFGALFTNVLAGSTYGTDKIYVKTVIE